MVLVYQRCEKLSLCRLPRRCLRAQYSTIWNAKQLSMFLRLVAKMIILSLSKDDGFAEPAPFDGSTELAEVKLRVLGASCWRRFHHQAEQ
jgi:hypothetical protein